MRPRRLVSVRAKRGRRLSSHGFRIFDLSALVVVTILVCDRESSGSLLTTPVGDVVPFVIAALVFGWALRSLGLYRFVRSEGLIRHWCQLAAAWILAVSAFLVTYRLVTYRLVDYRLVDDRLVTDESRVAACLQWSILTAVTLTGLHTVWWMVVRAWRAAGWLTPNLVIVGATSHAESIISDAIARGHVNIVGVFDDRLERSPGAVRGVPVLGDIGALLGHRIIPYVDRVVIAIDPGAVDRIREITTRLGVLPNEVTLFLGEDSTRRSALAQLEDLPLADLDRGADIDRRAFAKRLQDLLIAGPAVLLLSPLLAVVAVLIKIDSPGPVFFRQRRHGFNNEEIVVWKFRSMRSDAADAEAGAERQVTADDDRVTAVGRYLRNLSLDELPQLINVLRGNMSLVGPRPHAIGMKTGDVESAGLVSDYAHRHRVKPGLTGWAAINGSRGPVHTPAEVQRRVALDVDYIARQSFGLDLKIMALTVPRLLGDRHVGR